MYNNPAFYDAVIAGAGGGAQTSWLHSSDPSVYTRFKVSVEILAMGIDGMIAPIVGGPSISQIQLLQSITQAVTSGRFLNNLDMNQYDSLIQGVVTLFGTLVPVLTNMPANVVVPGYGMPGASVPGDTAAVGSAPTMANSAHRHAMLPYGMPGACTPGDTAVIGAVTAYANAAHQHAMAPFAPPGACTPGDTAATGTTGNFADAGHRHAMLGYGMPGACTPGDAAVIGAATAYANAAHQHTMLPFGNPISVGNTNSQGVKNEYARSDHQHALDATVTSRITFSPGTRSVNIYTVPALPTGNGRFVLTRCIARLSGALIGSGFVTISIGSTSGGTQVILPFIVNSSTSLGVVAGEAVATLGANMTTANAYEAVYAASQSFYANITASGIVTDGYIDIYMYGLFLNT